MKILLISILVIVSGCASTLNLNDPQIRKSILGVQVYENSYNQPHKELGVVETRYCTGSQISLTKGGNITKEGAITEMRYKASLLKANGITNIICQTDGVNFSTNCNNSIKCVGDAIKTNAQ